MNRKYHFKDDLADVAAICGEDVAIELVTKLPGIEVKIPARFSESNPLAMIDREIADRLIERFPGDKLYIPMKIVDSSKTLEISKLHEQGKLSLEIALMTGVTERYVRQVLAKSGRKGIAKTDDRQMDIERYLGDLDKSK
jgi:hypothetical protein